jgi:hypothetical protein
VNLWMKRAIGVAALGGALLALGVGTASAQEVSADVSARVDRSTSAEVRVCADGRVLSRLVGSCSGQAGSRRTSATVQAGRSSGSGGIRVRARVPRLASAGVSVGTGSSRLSTTASGQASATTRRARADAAAAADTSPAASADAVASLSRPRARRLLDLDAVASLAGVGLLGSSPFTLVGDPATDNLLPTGELTLADLTGEVPAGIGVLESGPIASGNQVAVDVGDVSPSVPVTVCGNGVGVLGDASASCGTGQAPSTGGGSTASIGTGTGSTGATGASVGTRSTAASVGTGSTTASIGTGSTGASVGTGSTGPSLGTGSTGPSAGPDNSLVGSLASGNQVDAGIGSVSASVPVTVCGNGVGALGDSSASCATGQQAGSGGTGGAGQPSGSGGGSTPSDGSGSGTEVSAEGVSASVPVTVCDNGVGLLGDALSSCGSDTSSGGIIAPPPATSPPGQSDTGTSGTSGTPGTGSTGTSGLLDTGGLTPGTSSRAVDFVTSFVPLRSSASDASGALPFTGAASDLLAVLGTGLVTAGLLAVRATRPDTATKGGGDR